MFAGEDSSLRLSEDARSILEDIVPSPCDFVLATLNRILQSYNAEGSKFEFMPESFTQAQRLVQVERSEKEMTALRRYSLPTTDFLLMLYDVGVVYGGLMFKASGLHAWEDAAMLLIDTLYPDYWRSWSAFKDEWDAYEQAARKITSLPDHVVDLIKISTIFNSCTSAVERKSNLAGYPSGIQDVVSALIYRSFESASYGIAANLCSCTRHSLHDWRAGFRRVASHS